MPLAESTRVHRDEYGGGVEPLFQLIDPTHGFATSVFVEPLALDDFESWSGVDPQAASRPRAAEIARNFFMAFTFCCHNPTLFCCRNPTLPWQPDQMSQPDSCRRPLMKGTFFFYYIS